MNDTADTGASNQAGARPCELWGQYTPARRRALLAMLFLVGTSSTVDRNVIGVLLEPIKREFHASDTMLGLLSGIAFALLYATLGIPAARWADRYNRKVVVTLSLGVWSVMTTLCGAAQTFWQLAVARFGVGSGEAGIIPTAQSLLSDYYSPEARSRAIGLFLTSGSAGYALGLVLGGYITQRYGWRATYFSFGMLGLALVPLCHLILHEPRASIASRPSWRRAESAGAAIRALLRKRAYRNILAGLVVYFVMAYGALVFVVSLMIRVHGLTTSQAGALFGAIAASGSLVGNVCGGALADRLATRDVAWLTRLAGWGMIVTLPLFEVALWSRGLSEMGVLLFLGAIVLSGVLPPAFSAIQLVCGSARRALSVALAFFFANLIGFGLGPVITGALSDRLSTIYGVGDGLRYAVMIVMAVLLPSALFMLRAAPHISVDAEE